MFFAPLLAVMAAIPGSGADASCDVRGDTRDATIPPALAAGSPRTVHTSTATGRSQAKRRKLWRRSPGKRIAQGGGRR